MSKHSVSRVDVNAHRCVFCPELLAEGDKIACPEHRRVMDEMPMPWDRKPERILIYGSRTWRDYAAIHEFVATLAPGTIVVHGGQVSVDEDTGELFGADHFAGRAAEMCDLQVEVHFADWKRHGRAAGPIRNREMADSKPDRARGFRMPGRSKGTDDMTRCLVAAGIPHDVTSRKDGA